MKFKLIELNKTNYLELIAPYIKDNILNYYSTCTRKNLLALLPLSPKNTPIGAAVLTYVPTGRLVELLYFIINENEREKKYGSSLYLAVRSIAHKIGSKILSTQVSTLSPYYEKILHILKGHKAQLTKDKVFSFQLNLPKLADSGVFSKLDLLCKSLLARHSLQQICCIPFRQAANDLLDQVFSDDSGLKKGHLSTPALNGEFGQFLKEHSYLIHKNGSVIGAFMVIDFAPKVASEGFFFIAETYRHTGIELLLIKSVLKTLINSPYPTFKLTLHSETHPETINFMKELFSGKAGYREVEKQLYHDDLTNISGPTQDLNNLIGCEFDDL